MTSTNIKVDVHGGQRFCVSWESGGARFHYWSCDEILTPADDVLYKNPPLGVVYKGPGYFETRHLKISKNIDSVAKVRAFAIENCLLEEGRERAAATEAKRLADAQAEYTKDTLNHVRQFARSVGEPIDEMSDDDLMAGLRRIFAKAEAERDT